MRLVTNGQLSPKSFQEGQIGIIQNWQLCQEPLLLEVEEVTKTSKQGY